MLTVYNVVLPSKDWLVSVARGMRNSYNSWDKKDTDTIDSDFINESD